MDALVDTPVSASRAGGGQGDVRDRGGGLAGVNSTEGKFTVDGTLGSGGSVVDTNGFSANGALGEEVVGNGGNVTSTGDGARSEVNRADTEDTINTIEARGSRSNTNGLASDNEAAGESNSVSVCKE